LSAIDNVHCGITRRGEGAPYLEDEGTIGVTLAVEGELPGELG
jgi:hypothetical protein